MNIIRFICTFFVLLIAYTIVLSSLFINLNSNTSGVVVVCTGILFPTMITIKVWEYFYKRNNKDQ